MLTEKSPKIPNFYCEKCKYITRNKKDFIKHELTSKHQKMDSLTNIEQKLTEKSPKIPTAYKCEKCEKIYKTRTGLWYHNKKCTYSKNVCLQDCNETTNEYNVTNIQDKTLDKNVITTELIFSMIQQSKELQNLLVEQSKTIFELSKNNQINNNSNNNINNINSNNKAFNLNFFLNETCKNAMNITDFVDSLQLQLCDLENVGRLGFVDGLSNIIIKNLKALDETERPIHCTDKKREIVYVRDDNKWEKDETLIKLRKAIKYVAHKNTKLIPQWKAKYPDYMDSSSIQSDQYNNMVIEVLGGEHDSNNNENKIIKKIVREVIIDK
jgi:hypothetical protein